MIVRIKGSNEVIGTVVAEQVLSIGLAYALYSIKGVAVEKDLSVSTQDGGGFFVYLPDGRRVNFEDINVECSSEEEELFRCADGVVRIPQ